MAYRLFNGIKSRKARGGHTIEDEKPHKNPLIKDAGYAITENNKPHINTLTGKVSGGGGDSEPPAKANNESPSDDADKVSEKKKINESVLASLVPATFSGIGDLFRIAGKFGGMNNNDSPNPLTPLANIATEIGIQSSIHDVSAGLGHQTKELIDEIGAVDTPGWAKLQLLEKLMQNRDAAFQRRLQYGFNR